MNKKNLVGIVIRTVLVLGIMGLLVQYGLYMTIRPKAVPSTAFWSESDLYNPEDIASLTLPEDRDFKILLLADIQLESDPRKDPRSYKAVKAMVKQSHPDLILTVGDNTSWIYADSLTEKFISLMESFETPWAVVLGNHDSEGRASREWHGDRYAEAAYSLFSKGPSNVQGIGNYGINLKNSDGTILYSLILMDSNELRDYGEGISYDFIYSDQIAWYKWMAESVNSIQEEPVPVLAFFHIPLPEFAEAVDAWRNTELPEGSWFGEIREDVCSSPVNTGLFDVMKEEGHTTHIFNGHDHVNNLSVDWEGIRMTYVQKTGPGSYTNEDMRGATVLTLSASGKDVHIEHVLQEE